MYAIFGTPRGVIGGGADARPRAPPLRLARCAAISEALSNKMSS
jgi:hypothetical protein